MIPGKRYTPELVLAIAWRRKWLILIPTVLIVSTALVIIYLLPDQYRSETTILVVPQRIPENYVRSTVTTRVGDRLRSINQRVRSRTGLEAVIQELDLYPERRKTDIMQDIVDDMSKNIEVDIVQGDDVFRVAFTGDQPRTAMQVTARLASFFIDESLKERESLADGASRFLETELEQAGQKLRENEQRVADYRRRHDGELPTQVDANMQGMSSARMQLQVLQGSLEQDRELQLTLQRQVTALSEAVEAASVPSAVAQDPAAPRTAAVQLQNAKLVLQNMLLKQKPDHPDVRKQQSVITELERKVEEEASQAPLTPAAPPNSALARRATELENARADLERVDRAIERHTAEQRTLNATIAQYQRRMEAAPVRDSELVDLMRDYTTLKQSYDSLLGKRIDSQISANLERGQIGEQFKMLDPARLPERPSSPDRPRLYMLALLFAIAVGLACAGVAEYLDRALRSEDDVRLALALPVLATIPVIGAERSKKSSKLLAGFASALILIAVAAGAIWYTQG